MNNIALKNNPYFWVSPAVIFFLIFLLGPLLFALAISFFHWDGFSRQIFKDFAGFSNYWDLFKDRVFLLALKNTLYFVFGVTIVQNIFAFFLAVLIFFGKFKNSDAIRAIIFFPGIISAVVISLVWRRILMSDGLINTILEVVKLPGIEFLSDKSIVIWTIIMITIWQWTGYNLVIMYAGLQSVNMEVVEASYIDGASFWQVIFRIIFPILKPTIWLSVILNFIGGFRTFDIVYILTRGGPAHASEVLTTYMYYNSFQMWGPSKMGYASAIAMFLTFVIIIFTALRIRFIRK